MPQANGPIHRFSNGVLVYREQLTKNQLARYALENLHDPQEEKIFLDGISAAKQQGLYVCIGSAIGYYPLLAHTVRPDLHILCFEPLRKHFEYMRHNILLNNASPQAFRLRTCAVSDRTGEARFVDMNYGSHIERNGGYIPSWAREGHVKTITLSEAVQHSAHIDMVQMDIQDHEKEVLYHYFLEEVRQGRIRAFLIATHSEGSHSECSRLLSENGYILKENIRRDRDIRDGILFASWGEEH